MRLFINPGHGGGDPGAVANGLNEADINAAIGAKLKEKLASYCEVNLLQVRSLSEIAKAANQVKADYFVSIHANAFSNASAHGIETYHYPGSAKGQAFARSVQTELIKKLGRSDRGVKSANFQVLKETAMPAILTEIGFITNKEESDLMRTAQWQNDAAEALAIGISNYCGLNYRATTPNAKPDLETVLKKAEDVVTEIKKLI